MANTQDFSLAIDSLVAKYYTDLPYHNFAHAQKAASAGLKICQRCQNEGVAIDEQVVYFALLFHDAGYQESPQEKGFKNKEEYSAFLADEALTKVRFSKNLISKVKKAIISTNQNQPFKTPEEKAVRAADLSEMGGTYKQFHHNTILLKQEAELFSKKKISWGEWKETTKRIVEFYLAQDIHLTSAYADKDGHPIFHQKVWKNLERFLSEPVSDGRSPSSRTTSILPGLKHFRSLF